MSAMRRILLAEDNPNDIELMLAALETSQLDNAVDVVRDGVEVLDYLFRRGRFADRSEANPVVIFLDIKMPKVSGLEVLREIRRNERFDKIPVVMLTSSREKRDIAESYQLLANAYVVKPVDFEEYAETVGELGRFWGLRNEPPPDSATAEPRAASA
jgi:CheY-like chemotaxis protein